MTPGIEQGHSIKQEHFSELHEAIAKLEPIYKRLLPSSLGIHGVPTENEMRNHMEVSLAVYKTIESIREKYADLMGFIDHDIRTHFTHIIAGFDVLSSNQVSPTIKAELAPMTPLVEQHMLPVIHAVEAIRFWVEGEQLTPQPVMLSDFFKKVVPYLHHAFDQNRRKIELEIEAGLRVNLHEATLGMLLANMGKNAAHRGEASTLKIKAFSSGSEIFITVEDDGKGIEEGIADRIFDYGVSGAKSTGIGLANAPERLKAMGGEIQCLPHGGLENPHHTQGAKFVIKLQAAA